MKKRWLWLAVLWMLGWLIALNQMFGVGSFDAPIRQQQQNQPNEYPLPQKTTPISVPIMKSPDLQTTCETVKNDFLVDYEKVFDSIKWNEPNKYGLRGRYADGDALCGRYLLWNMTQNDIWTLSSPTAAMLSNITHQTGSTYTATLSNCGQVSYCSDLYITARLVGKASISPCEVLKYRGDNNCKFVINYSVKEPGDYELHIKVVELNGSSTVASDPRSLGIDRSRIRINGKKLFAHLVQCGRQRHIIGSPFKVSFEGEQPDKNVPTCRYANYTSGRWVPFSNNYCSTPQPHCVGNPWWLADSYGFNGEWLWAPDNCKYTMYSPPTGPTKQCFDRKGPFGIIGDSLAREYVQSCKLFHLNNEGPGFHCDHWHMIIKGEFFSKEYAKSVVKVIIDKIHSDKPVGIGVNLGMMHMVGMCNDSSWEFFVSHFADQLIKRPVSFSVRKIWLGAPQVHYATLGMSEERATRWDEIALKHLTPIGFEYLNATPITYAREEGSWDGLHNAAEKGRKQSIVVNRKVKQFKWNGGIAHMLWVVLLNLLCPEGMPMRALVSPHRRPPASGTPPPPSPHIQNDFTIPIDPPIPLTATWKGYAPSLLKEKIRVFYCLFGEAQDIELSDSLADDYPGREGRLFRQLETKYPLGKGFFAVWDAITALFRLRDEGRVADVGKLLLKSEGDLSIVLRALQQEYHTSYFTDRNLLEKSGSDYSGYREIVNRYFQRNDPKKTTATDALLRAFEGSESELICQLEARYNSNSPAASIPSPQLPQQTIPQRAPIVRRPPPKHPCEIIGELARKDAIIDQQAQAVHEHIAAIRNEEHRSDIARQHLPGLIASAVSQTDRIAENGARTGNIELVRDASDSKKELQHIATAVGGDIPTTGTSRPAATDLEVTDLLHEVGNLKGAATKTRQELQVLANFLGMDTGGRDEVSNMASSTALPDVDDEMSRMHSLNINTPSTIPIATPSQVLERSVGNPLSQDEAVELLAQLIYKNSV